MAYEVVFEGRLDIIPATGGYPTEVNCKQYDGDYTRQMKFTMYKDNELWTIPYSVKSVVIDGTKPNQEGFSYDCTWSGSVVTAPLMYGMTDQSGKIPFDVIFLDADNNRLGAARGYLLVERAALQNDEFAKSNSYQVLKGYADSAKYYEELSKSYAMGDTDIRTLEDIDNSKYYSSLSRGYAEMAQMYKGAPLTATAVSDMTDAERVYVYTGNESDYTNGNWYYYDGTNWVSGGVYNAVAVQTDTTLSIPEIPADSEAVGKQFDAINKKSRRIDMHRLFRVLGRYEDYTGQTAQGDLLDYGQGMCVVDGTSVIVTLCNRRKYSDKVRVVEVSLSDYTIMRETILPLGHANGICYNPKNNYIYVAPLLHSANGAYSGYWNGLLVYDYTTLTLVKEVDTGWSVSSVSYDIKTEKMHLLKNVSTSSQTYDVYEYDYVNDTVGDLLFPLIKTFDGVTPTQQCIRVYDNKVYDVKIAPRVILQYDIDGTLEMCYLMDDWYDDKFRVGEVEDIDFDVSGNMYIYSVTYAAYPTYIHCQVWKYNIEGKNYSLKSIAYGISPETIYIGENTSLNPDGTTNNPFPTIGEACVALGSPFIRPTILEFKGSRTYDEVMYIYGVNITVLGNNSTIPFAAFTYFGYAHLLNLNIVNNTPNAQSIRFYRGGIASVESCNISHEDSSNEYLVAVTNCGSMSVRGTCTFGNYHTKAVIRNASGEPIYFRRDLAESITIEDVYMSTNGTPVILYPNIKDVNDTYSIPATIASELQRAYYHTLSIRAYVYSSSARRTSLEFALTSSTVTSNDILITYPFYDQNTIKIYRMSIRYTPSLITVISNQLMTFNMSNGTYTTDDTDSGKLVVNVIEIR